MYVVLVLYFVTFYFAHKHNIKPCLPALYSIVFFNLFSYNPIGNIIGSCPPLDWRNPPFIDQYNQITKRLCEKFNIPLIDTNDIVGVTWDRAPDWCHYNDTSGTAEATYLLRKIFE